MKRRRRAANLDQVRVAAVLASHDDILKLRMKSHSHAGGQRPGSRRPNDDVDSTACECRIECGRVGQERIFDVNRPAAVVFVFDLRLRQRRLVTQAPVDRLAAAIDVTLLQEPHEGLGDVGLVVELHGQVRLVPFPEHPQPLKIIALQVDVLFRIAAAGAPDFHDAHLSFLGTEFLIDVDFNLQAVAVPAGKIGSVKARNGF